jgi:hypothetical protein
MKPRANLVLFASALVMGACAASPATVQVTIPPPAQPVEVPVEVAPQGRGLRLSLEDPALFVDGHKLVIRDSAAHVREVIGAPTWSKDYDAGQGAMSNSTYLHYDDRGLTVRTKDGVAEAFYVYFRPTELDGHTMKPARPELPRGLPFDATFEQALALLGEPTKRNPMPVMDWNDLLYVVKDALIELHFDHGVFASVSLMPASFHDLGGDRPPGG